MFTYNYQAKNINGIEFSGQVPASNRQEVISILKRKGLYLFRVESQNRLSGIFSQNTQIKNHIGIRDKAIFAHQLATLLRAGMMLTTALKTLSKQNNNKHFKTVIAQIHDKVEQSSTLSEAMSMYPKVFSRVYTTIVEAAEQSGSLVETLLMLSKQLKSQASVNSRIKSALMYPIFLLSVSILVVGVLITFVIPKFIELFVNANQALPIPTRILIGLTGFLKDSWWVVLVFLLSMVCIIVTVIKNKRFKLFFDSLMLNIPMVGSLNRKLQLARFARTLGSLLNGGVRILAAVETTKRTINNDAFVKEISDIEQKVLKGSTIGEAMKQQKYFTEIVISMTTVGEETGMLAEMLLEIADMYDQESESAINSMTTLLGPLMIVILGFIIGFVVLAILMPIFETSTMVG